MCDLWCILDFQSIRFYIDGIVTVSHLCVFFGVFLVTTIDLLTKDHTQGKNLLLRNNFLFDRFTYDYLWAKNRGAANIGSS